MTKGTSWPNRIKRRNCHISICSATYRDGTIGSFDVDWSRCKELYWIIERYILENAHWLCTWASLWNQGICSQFLGGKNHNCFEGGVKHFCCFIENGGTKHFLKALERVWNISNFPCGRVGRRCTFCTNVMKSKKYKVVSYFYVQFCSIEIKRV